MGNSAMLELDREIDFRIPIIVDREKQAHEGNFFFKAIASTTDIDLVADVITEEALETAKDDLLKNPTIFLDHKREIRVGTVVATEYDKKLKAIVITGQILNSRPDIKEEIMKGSLSKISIGARVLNGHREIDEKTGIEILKITRMRLRESSLVGLPANQEARTLEFWTEKSEKEIKEKVEKQKIKGAKKMDIIKDAALGRKVRRLREARDMSRDQLGQRIGITGSTVGQIERGEIDSPPDNRLSRIARAFGISVSSLVSGTGLAKSMNDSNKEEVMGESANLDVKDETVEKETPVIEAVETFDAGDLKKDLTDIAAEVGAEKKFGTASAQMTFLMNRLKSDGNEATKAIVGEMEKVFVGMVGSIQKDAPSALEQKMDGLLIKFGELLAQKTPKAEEADPDKDDKDPKGKVIEKSEKVDKPIPRVIRKGEAERADVDINKTEALQKLAKTTKEGLSPHDGIQELVDKGIL